MYEGIEQASYACTSVTTDKEAYSERLFWMANDDTDILWTYDNRIVVQVCLPYKQPSP